MELGGNNSISPSQQQENARIRRGKGKGKGRSDSTSCHSKGRSYNAIWNSHIFFSAIWSSHIINYNKLQLQQLGEL
jgi:hypothetical protein